jgi:hypothetical protein
MTDPLLASVLAEAALSSAPRGAISRVYPTLDAVLSATLPELADAGGADEATRIWEVLERRWRSEAGGTDLDPGPVPSRLRQLVEAASAEERPASLRVQLRVLALLDVTMRAAGFDPDAGTREDA